MTLTEVILQKVGEVGGFLLIPEGLHAREGAGGRAGPYSGWARRFYGVVRPNEVDGASSSCTRLDLVHWNRRLVRLRHVVRADPAAAHVHPRAEGQHGAVLEHDVGVAPRCTDGEHRDAFIDEKAPLAKGERPGDPGVRPWRRFSSQGDDRAGCVPPLGRGLLGAPSRATEGEGDRQDCWNAWRTPAVHSCVTLEPASTFRNAQPQPLGGSA